MIMNKLLLSGCIAILILFVVVPGHASLINNGYDSNGNHLIYDTDLNITWYDAPTMAMHWSQAMSWAASLSIAGTAVGSWRLPINLQVNGSSYNYLWCIDGSRDSGWNIISPTSEMAYLFYVELGNKGLWAPDGTTPQPGYGLINKGPFKNLIADYYWYGIEYKNTLGDVAWFFDFNTGEQFGAYKDTGDGRPFVLAVHSGYVLSNGIVLPEGPPVPIPGTIFQLATGLAGIILLRKKFNGYRKNI